MSIVEKAQPAAETNQADAPARPAASVAPRPGRRVLAPTAAFTAAAAGFAALYLAAGAPSPLFPVLERQWAFPAWVLTVAFAIYAIALLAALLVGGALSDHIGRRPVIIGSLVVETVAMLIFVFAPDIGWVIVARAVQGLATGVATSAFTAALVELAPPHLKRLGGVIGGAAPAGGLALGALLTGFAVQFAPMPTLLVFGILAAVMVASTVLMAFAPETVPGRPGALRSLVPRIAIPRAARPEFAAGAPVVLAAWMLAGLFIALAPLIVRDVFGIDSGAIDGATAFVEPAAAAVAAILLGSLAARRASLIGSAGVLVGAVMIVAGVAVGWLPLFVVGGIVGGVGFGASFSGMLRAVGPFAAAEQRAELFAGVFLVAYLGFGVPSIIAGQLIGPLGLFATVLLYGLAILLVALVGLAAQGRLARAAR